MAMAPTTLERPEGAPPDWEEMSIFEQLAVIPEEDLDQLLSDLVANGLDFGDPKVVLRPKQLKVVESEAH